VTKFFHQILISVLLPFLAFLCYIALNISNAYKLMPQADNSLMSSEEERLTWKIKHKVNKVKKKSLWLAIDLTS